MRNANSSVHGKTGYLTSSVVDVDAIMLTFLVAASRCNRCPLSYLAKAACSWKLPALSACRCNSNGPSDCSCTPCRKVSMIKLLLGRTPTNILMDASWRLFSFFIVKDICDYRLMRAWAVSRITSSFKIGIATGNMLSRNDRGNMPIITHNRAVPFSLGAQFNGHLHRFS
ncbi:hypothetical protein MPSEU_000910100 [Mayamaea pseudoterrestris]|nr:hypothetical protein MPSEU_000910100 [Mayamaea pseudoterrestris]